MAQRTTRLSTEQALNIQLGQGPSAYIDQAVNAFTPKNGDVVIAITIVQDAQFDQTEGLIAQDPSSCFKTVGGVDGAYDRQTKVNATGDTVNASTVFPTGLTIYGRWTSVKLDSGVAILYMGG